MSVTVTIAGKIYPVAVGSLDIKDQIEQASECTFSVVDPVDQYVFQKGQTVVVADSIEGNLFTGIVHTSKRDREGASTGHLKHNIECLDQHVLAEGQSSNKQYNGQYAAPILVDQIKNLAHSGLVANYAMDTDETIGDWSAGQLANTVATADGLELAHAGVPIAVTGTGASLTSGNGLSLSGYASSGYSNCNNYRQIAAVSIMVGSTSDYLKYDIWIASTSPQYMSGIDFICSDGSILAFSSAVDQQNIFAHAWSDLSGLANDQWYTRIIYMPASLVGKTITNIMVGMEGDNAGQYQSYFRRISYTASGGATTIIFGDNSSLQMNSQITNNGYSNVSLTQVQVSDKTGIITHPAINIDSVKIIRDSQMTYGSTIPDGCSGIVETSIDNGASWQTHASGNAIPNLIPAMIATGRSIFYRHTLTLAKDPTAVVSFSAPALTINSAYNSTKTDVVATYTTATNFNTGTLTNTKTVGSSSTPGLTLNGFQRNWDDANISGQTLYGSASPTQSVTNKQYRLATTGGGDAKSQLVFAGQWQNFIAECDVTVPANTVLSQGGFIYRTTGWQNNIATDAYYAMISQNNIQLGYGTNSSSGTGTFTALSTVALNLAADSVHRLKLIINGNNHQIYLDNVLLINYTDGTYPNAGYLGLRAYSNTGALTVAFDNFGVCSALSGVWQSPSIDISGPATYGNSVVQWDVDGLPDSTTIISAQTSVNGGSTWQNVTNGGAISGLTAGGPLAGVHLLIKMTLTASNTPVVPTLNGITVWIMGQYSSTGTRISPALLLDAVGYVGSTLAAYNAILPTNTSVVMATSPDGVTWTNVVSGSPIPGITQQPAPAIDNFNLLTAGSYTSTARTGGSAVSWAWDTVNSRLAVSSGNNSLLIYGAVSCSNVDVISDMDEADCGGLVWRWIDANNFYELDAFDGSSSAGSTNVLKLYKVVSNVKTQIAVGAITLTRGVKGRVRVVMIGTSITAYFDGNQVLTASDSAIAGPGQVGLITVSGLARFCSLRIQPQGDNLAGRRVYGKFTLNTTDPTQTPQVTLATLLATSPNIGIGNLIDTANYQQTYISDNIGDLTNRSDGYTWTIQSNGALFFNGRQALPAPWALSDKDALINGITVEQSGDLYRNRQTLTGVVAADGSTTHVTRDNLGQFPGTISQEDYINQSGISIPTPVVLNLASVAHTANGDSGDLDVSLILALALDINITAVSGTGPTIQFFVDRKGADGSYYQLWNSSVLTTTGQISISIGAFCPVNVSLGSLTRVRWAIGGTLPSWTFSISALGALDIEGAGIGVVEAVEDVSKLNLSVSAANDYADSRLKEYGIYGRTAQFATQRTGLKAGMSLSVTVTAHKMQNVPMLVTSVERTAGISSSGNVRYWFTCTAVEGPALDTWRKAMNQTVKGG